MHLHAHTSRLGSLRRYRCLARRRGMCYTSCARPRRVGRLCHYCAGSAHIVCKARQIPGMYMGCGRMQLQRRSLGRGLGCAGLGRGGRRGAVRKLWQRRRMRFLRIVWEGGLMVQFCKLGVRDTINGFGMGQLYTLQHRPCAASTFATTLSMN